MRQMKLLSSIILNEESVAVLSKYQKKFVKTVNFLKKQVKLFYENESKIIISHASSTNDLFAANEDVEIKKHSKHKKRIKNKINDNERKKSFVTNEMKTQGFKFNEDDFPVLNGDNTSRPGYSCSSKNVIKFFCLF